MLLFIPHRQQKTSFPYFFCSVPDFKKINNLKVLFEFDDLKSYIVQSFRSLIRACFELYDFNVCDHYCTKHINYFLKK